MAYTVRVVTGKESQGVDTEVFISLQGSDGAVLHFLLDKEHSLNKDQHLFKAGHEDIFKIDHEPIGEITVVQVVHRPTAPKNENWFLDSISVDDNFGTIYTFPCYNWLSSNKGDGREERSLLQGPLEGTEEVPPPTEAFVVAKPRRNLIVKSRHSCRLDGLCHEELPTDPKKARALLEKCGTRITFKNWASTVEVKNVLAFYPTTIGKIQCIIKLAAIAGLKVRSCGSGHSWSMLYADEGQVLIDPQYLGPDDEKVVLSDDKTHVTIMANATTFEVKQEQLQKKFSLMFNVILGAVTYGGTVNTGCHGVGKGCPALPDLVTELQVVNDSGELVTYNKTTEGEDFMKAVTTNLGLFGFVYKTTMKVEPREYLVETSNEFRSVRDTIADKEKLKALAEMEWSLELFWFPYNSMALDGDQMKKLKTEEEFEALPIAKKLVSWDPLDDECWLRLIKFVDEGEPKGWLFYLTQAFMNFFEHVTLKKITPVLTRCPIINPAFCWLTNLMLKTQPDKIIQELPQAIHYRKFIHLAPVYDMEFAFVVDDDYGNISDACMVVVNKIKEHAEKGKFPTNLCLEMRFMGQSDSLICPAVVGQNSLNACLKTAYIEILTLVDTPHWQDFSREVAEAWCAIGGKQNVKPLVHWAKELEPVPNLAAYLWENNGENMSKFLDCLGRKVDMEKKLFFNDFLDGIFRRP